MQARIIRVIKVGTFKENLILVAEGLRRSITGLILLVYLVLIFMVVMASVMYMLESDTEPCEVIEVRPYPFRFQFWVPAFCAWPPTTSG